MRKPPCNLRLQGYYFPTCLLSKAYLCVILKHYPILNWVGKAMPNTITNRQMFLMLFICITAVAESDISRVTAQNVGRSGWIAILLTAILFAAAAFLWTKLNNLHQGKMLFDYSKELVGKAGAYFLALYFTQYFITVLVSLNITMSAILQSNFLPKTPVWATSLASLPVIGFVAYKGVTNTARLVEIYGVILIVTSIVVHLIMLMEGDKYFILPLFNPADTGKILSSVKEFTFSFLGFEVLAVIPFSVKQGPKTGAIAAIALLVIGLFYVLIVETNIMMIGVDEIKHYNFPLVVAIRQVEIPLLKVFQRIDVLYLTVGFIGLFGGLSVIYLSIVEFICRMLPKIKRSIIVIAIGVIAILTETVIYGIEDINIMLKEIITYSGVFAACLVPLMLYIITKVKNRGTKKTA